MPQYPAEVVILHEQGDNVDIPRPLCKVLQASYRVYYRIPPMHLNHEQKHRCPVQQGSNVIYEGIPHGNLELTKPQHSSHVKYDFPHYGGILCTPVPDTTYIVRSMSAIAHPLFRPMRASRLAEIRSSTRITKKKKYVCQQISVF